MTNLTVGDITGIDKKGWEYLWVRYADGEDAAAKPLVKKAIAVYVERVYKYGDFRLLGISGPAKWRCSRRSTPPTRSLRFMGQSDA